jgi:hypothetical protein
LSTLQEKKFMKIHDSNQSQFPKSTIFGLWFTFPDAKRWAQTFV